MSDEPDASLVEREHQFLAKQEQHFNTIQAGIRGLASAWLLAAFAAIGLLLKPAEQEELWLLPAEWLVVLICVMGETGLWLLWVIDQHNEVEHPPDREFTGLLALALVPPVVFLARMLWPSRNAVEGLAKTLGDDWFAKIVKARNYKEIVAQYGRPVASDQIQQPCQRGD